MGSNMQPKANHKFPCRLTVLAKSLRKQSTNGEKKLWSQFQKLRLSHGIRFRRQQPIGRYIADFYSAAYKCVVEIDGTSHDSKIICDVERDNFMRSLGLTILRFTEHDAQSKSEAVLETILTHLKLTPTYHT